ncbi:dihydrolipoyllysine-residue acetyltransferase [Halomonas sp. DN3]|uniref:dihydrolipoyllysine-residue acetyltransferase n=1 Tax=Halomonas sp. DN3 TaxID=2953657 RepID=UPI0020A19CAD|nr:dihydrolipoyllysine-residue acetyltransferase [Halomonas sp. DN3]USZ47981.1 dihydrolipoyllysine-residue acetyltransferase [Halomonas sp. DN3]
MTEFKLPDIGEGIVECEVMEWKIAEGDTIAEDQPVVEVMTDKALVEITAPEAGVVTRLHVAKGEMARVHAPLFAYRGEHQGGDGQGEEAQRDEGQTESEGNAPAQAASPKEAPVHKPAEPVEPPSSSSKKGGAGRRVDFILPDIGEGIVECEIVEWHVAQGDEISEDQRLVDVMTDKAMVEITAPEDGVVAELYVAKGEMAKVHAPLFAYQVAGAAAGEAPAVEEASPPTPTPTPTPTPKSDSPVHKTASEGGKGPYGRIPASPAVRRLIREHQLRLEDIPGSGRQGRVLKEDVLSFLDGARHSGAVSAADSGSDSGAESAGTGSPAGTDATARDEGEVRVEPLRGVRAAMARQMVAAASSVPHFQYGEEIDVTDLLALRGRLKPQAAARDVKLTLMPFFIKALALAIDEHPLVNARLNDEATEIHYPPHCNVGMAVDGKAGLMVPNIKGCERLSLLEIAAEVQRLTEAAREGRVAASDLKGGTISISNIGALGGTYAAPIINIPESAIVAIGKTQWLPRFDEAGQVVRRGIMTVTWAGDHRLLDGGTIARFCNAWKGYLEDPESMLLHLS